MAGRRRLLLSLGLGLAVGSAPPAVGSAPRFLQAQEVELYQWRSSPHAGSMDTPEESEGMNRPGCAHCHTAQGYIRVTLGGEESGAPYADATGLICRTCHLPGEGSVGVGALRVASTRDACQGCHDELVINEPDELSWSAQGGVFSGTGGAHIPDRRYPTSTHTTLEDGCVSCHMAATEERDNRLLVGGHTFRVRTKGQSPAVFNRTLCAGCHNGITSDGVTLIQRDVQHLLDALAELLPQKPHPTEPGETEPRYPADPSLNEVQARGSWNYWLIQKDGTLGVHNPRYTRELLRNSILELRAGSGEAG